MTKMAGNAISKTNGLNFKIFTRRRSRIPNERYFHKEPPTSFKTPPILQILLVTLYDFVIEGKNKILQGV